MPYEQPDEASCMPECLEAQPAGFGGVPRCICDYLNEQEEAYRAEPDDLAAREWGG
jgi:hypothetical protein